MKQFFIRYFPFIVIFSLWFIFSSPYFLKGKVPYPSTYQVNHFAPWSAFEKFWGPVRNGAMPDVIDQIYPWKYFTIRSLKEGKIPFWNPYSFSGNPHVGNFQSAVFSPLNILFFIFSFVDAWSMLILIQPILAAFFTYLLVRELGMTKIASLASAVVFMFCGFMVVWMAYGTLPMAISFLPLSLYSLEKSFKKITKTFWIIFISSIPLSLFSGHFQTSFYFLFAITLFILFKTVTTRKYKITLFITLSLFVGIMISLVQIIPTIQLYLHSVRSEIFVSGGGMSLPYLVTIFAPDFYGNPVTRNDWVGNYAEWASFIGTGALLLSMFTFIRKKNIQQYFFLFLGLLALLLAVDMPLQRFLSILKIPVISTSIPSRIIVLFSFSFAVLAGYGLDILDFLLQKKEKFKIIFPILILGFVLVMVWVLLLLLNVLPVDKVSIAKRNLIIPTGILLGASSLIILAYAKKRLSVVLPFLLLIIISFESTRFAQKWMPFDPRGLVYPDTKVIEAIKKNVGFGRVYGNLGGQVDTYYGLSLIEGYDPLYIQRYGEFIQSAEKGDYSSAFRSVVKLSRTGVYTDRVLDLLGVSIIFHPIADTNQGWAYPVWNQKNRFLKIYQDDKFQLFKNKTAMPRATLFYNYIVISDKKEIIKTFYKDEFDFRRILILEEDPQIPKIKNFPAKEAEISLYTPNSVVIKTNSKEKGVLFLSDNYYPGWKVYINGKETKIYRANYTFRGIVIPQGKSTVEFVYKGLL